MTDQRDGNGNGGFFKKKFQELMSGAYYILTISGIIVGIAFYVASMRNDITQLQHELSMAQREVKSTITSMKEIDINSAARLERFIDAVNKRQQDVDANQRQQDTRINLMDERQQAGYRRFDKYEVTLQDMVKKLEGREDKIVQAIDSMYASLQELNKTMAADFERNKEFDRRLHSLENRN